MPTTCCAARRGRMLDWAGESQYYAEPKRLARLGYLGAHKEPGRTRERTVYTLTDRGQEALLEWARTPVRFTPLKSEPLLRVMITDLVGAEITRGTIGTLRDDIAELSAQLDDAELRAEALPHRRENLLLVVRFLRRLLDLHSSSSRRSRTSLAPAAPAEQEAAR